MADLTTTEAANRLGVSGRWVRNMVAHGDLNGRQLSDGTWLIDSASLNAHQRQHTPQGRNWSPAASWALLATLSGFHLPGISDSTTKRIRRRIRETDPAAIARRVADRVTWHTFTTDPSLAVANDLALTGRAVAEAVDTRLADHKTVTEGYVPDTPDALDRLRRRHLLAPDPDGTVRIALRPESWPFTTIAPVIVIAADLAQSPSPRDRAAGVEKIAEMRDAWLATHTQ